MPTRLEARVDKHDKQIAAIQKLIMTGMKMINRNAAQIEENSAAIKVLIKEQRETGRILKDLMRSLGRQDQANGHGKPPKGL